MINKPYSESCEQNKAVIYQTIKPFLTGAVEVLEIGSGTGQHAIYFASMVPELIWQSSDLAENLPAIKSWIDDSKLFNLPEPVEFDVSSGSIDRAYDIVFSANTFHIMNHHQVEQCFLQCKGCLKVGGHLIIYGPFNYDGKYTSASNEQFDGWLKSRDPLSGIKHFEWINQLASESGLRLVSDTAMPANNRTLILQHETFEEK